MNSSQIANVIAFYSYYHPKEDINSISSKLKLPPALIVNAIYEGERRELFTTEREGAGFKRIVVSNCPAPSADFGDEIAIVKERIVETITNLNKDKQDIEKDNLMIWLGVPVALTFVARTILMIEGVLAKYVITDYKDPKSRYEFFPLMESLPYHYGTKQFKKTPAKKDIRDVVIS